MSNMFNMSNMSNSMVFHYVTFLCFLLHFVSKRAKKTALKLKQNVTRKAKMKQNVTLYTVK